jgi:hypothetical protein
MLKGGDPPNPDNVMDEPNPTTKRAKQNKTKTTTPGKSSQVQSMEGKSRNPHLPISGMLKFRIQMDL